MCMKKSISLVTVLILIVLMFAGCASKSAEPAAANAAGKDSGKKLKIAFIGTTNVDESIKWFAKNAQEEATAQGVEFVAFDPNGDVQKQTNMVTDAIASKCDGIVIQCLDKTALIPALKKAKEAGLVVTLFGADIDPSGQQYRDFVCAPDDLAAGKLAAETFLKIFPNGATGVEIMGGAGEDPAIKREKGFDSGIQGSKLRVLEKMNIPGWDPAKAMSTTEDFMTKYGEKIQFIYCHWDNGAVSVVQALEAKGMLDKVKIISVDGCRAGFELVKSGKTSATMFQDMALQSKECVKAVVKIKGGEKVDPVEVVPWKVITKDNANFDPGW